MGNREAHTFLTLVIVQPGDETVVFLSASMRSLTGWLATHGNNALTPRRSLPPHFPARGSCPHASRLLRCTSVSRSIHSGLREPHPKCKVDSLLVPMKSHAHAHHFRHTEHWRSVDNVLALVVPGPIMRLWAEMRPNPVSVSYSIYLPIYLSTYLGTYTVATPMTTFQQAQAETGRQSPFSLPVLLFNGEPSPSSSSFELIHRQHPNLQL